MPLPFMGLKLLCWDAVVVVVVVVVVAVFCTNVLQDKDEIVILHPLELSSLSQHSQFAAAAYSAKSLKFMGVCNSLIYWTSNESAIYQLCGIPPNNAL
jgi:hypothetical protein